MLPTISIITPVFNGGECVEDCLLSVIEQSYPNKEHIIVDGLSKDNTMEIVKKYSSQEMIRFVSEKDKGIYDAMNKGIQMATGDYLFFLGADDVFYDHDVLVDIFGNEQNNIDVDFLYGKALYTTANKVYGREVSLEDLKEFQLNHQSIFYSRTVFETIGKFEIQYKICADAIFNIKCFKKNSLKKKFVNKTISRFNDTGLSNSDARDLQYQKDYLTLFDRLTLKETLKKIYYQTRPDWFKPALWLKKIRQ